MLHHEPLSVLSLIVDDADARCMIHYFAFAIVPQVVSCVVAPVAVDVLQIESSVRPVEIEDGCLLAARINLRDLAFPLLLLAEGCVISGALLIYREAKFIKLDQSLAVFGVLSPRVLGQIIK